MSKRTQRDAAATDTGPRDDEGDLFERPDGFFWRSKYTAREYGPFATLLAAIADMEVNEAPADDDEGIAVAETAEEAAAEVGISGWIDEESGELGEEERPRIEEH
jgi:hypothetical protein